MLNKFIFPAFLSLVLTSTSVFALTCANDYGGTQGCASNTTAAGDCETLGYSTQNTADCEHYLYCPFDKAYKRCVAIAENNTCTYQYTIAEYPNVKEIGKNDSCTRDGATYYRDICPGISLSKCQSQGGTLKNICYAYNGAQYGTCDIASDACTYQYSIAQYPNVKQVAQNASCVRDGVTYYRDICPGISSSECSAQGGVLSNVCYTYNGNQYGNCSKPISRNYKLNLKLSPSANGNTGGDCMKCVMADWQLIIGFKDPATNELVSSATYTATCSEVIDLHRKFPKTVTVNFDKPLIDGKQYRVVVVQHYGTAKGRISAGFDRISVNGQDFQSMIDDLATGALLTTQSRFLPEVNVDADLCGHM